MRTVLLLLVLAGLAPRAHATDCSAYGADGCNPAATCTTLTRTGLIQCDPCYCPWDTDGYIPNMQNLNDNFCKSGVTCDLKADAGDTLDASAADTTKPCKTGTSLPGTCTEGECFQDTDSGGVEIYWCTATNTWSTPVSLDNTQTISGAKTFTGGLTVSTVTTTLNSVTNAVGGVSIGSSGTTINASFAGSNTINFASIGAGACGTDATITVTGAAAGDVVALGIPTAAIVAGSTFYAWTSATNTVSVRHCCITGTCDPGSGSFKARVFN